MGRFIHSCGVAWGAAMTVLAIEGWALLIAEFYRQRQETRKTETKDTYDLGNKE